MAVGRREAELPAPQTTEPRVGWGLVGELVEVVVALVLLLLESVKGGVVDDAYLELLNTRFRPDLLLGSSAGY